MVSPMYSHNKHGFTLIEVLIVLSLMTIIIGLSAGLLLRTKPLVIREARSEIKSLLAVARGEAMYRRDGRMVGVIIEAGNMSLVSALPTATTTTLQVLETDSKTVNHITTDPDKVEIWFYPYSGRVSSPGAITLHDARSLASTSITIGYEGSID
jgi:prepilin-type N-terminal cleavage/methylation domain-containing protein